MTSSSIFGSPMLVGFEPFEQMLEQVVKSSTDGYPPYNIEKITEHHFRISLAVAGFIIEELEVEVETSQLKVIGRQEEKGNRSFLHHGIATRQFQRRFALAAGLEVTGSWLDNGILHIDIERPVPEVQVRRIKIKNTPHREAGRS